MKKYLLLLWVVLLSYGLFIFLDAHRLRASLIPTQQVVDENIVNSKDGLLNFQENAQFLEEYSNIIPDSFKFGNPNHIIPLFSWYTSTYYSTKFLKKHHSKLSSEYPSNLLKQYANKDSRGSCYNDAIFLGFIFQLNGYKVRQIAFTNKDGYGNRGHTLLEVWHSKFNKWILFDSQNACFYTQITSLNPLSALEIRQAILLNDSAHFYNAIQISQFNGNLKGKSKLYQSYKNNCDELVYNSFNNPLTMANTSSLYKLTKQLSEIGNKHIEKAARLIRSLFDKTRINTRYVDEYSPAINYNGWYVGFNVWTFLFIITLLLTYFFWFKR